LIEKIAIDTLLCRLLKVLKKTTLPARERRRKGRTVHRRNGWKTASGTAMEQKKLAAVRAINSGSQLVLSQKLSNVKRTAAKKLIKCSVKYSATTQLHVFFFAKLVGWRTVWQKRFAFLSHTRPPYFLL
jgi:hypothetical protein